ncbi:hypothetical protein B0J14DRAFT_93026 [Halenospora varia]|nr:hypothetical protein B0J14DRAFT_93026 [Halenospora varia]
MTSESSSPTASKAELEALLRLSFSQGITANIVLDGIDEFPRSYAPLEFLRELAALSGLHILLISRPNIEYLQEHIDSSQRIIFDAKTAHHDIRCYLHREIQRLYGRHCLHNQEGTPAVVDHIVYVSNGVFLWASLMIEYLSSPALTPTERVKAIWEVELPEGLETMYDRIFCLIAKSRRPERDLAERVFMLLQSARSPFTDYELHEALAFSSSNRQSEPVRLHRHSASAIILSCGGLVEKKNHATAFPNSSGYRFIHLSVVEFPNSVNAGIPEELRSSQVDRNLHIASLFIRYLTTYTLSKPFSGRLGIATTSDRLNSDLPFFGYTGRQWFNHTYDAIFIAS